MARGRQRKSGLIKVYMTATQKDEITAKADRAGQGASGYLLDAGLRRGIPQWDATAQRGIRLAEQTLERLEEIASLAQDRADGLLILAKLDALSGFVHFTHRLEMSSC